MIVINSFDGLYLITVCMLYYIIDNTICTFFKIKCTKVWNKLSDNYRIIS